MRRWLVPLEKAGKIDVEEEFKQACFHITVYKAYLQAGGQPSQPAKSVQPIGNPPVSAAQDPADHSAARRARHGFRAHSQGL